MRDAFQRLNTLSSLLLGLVIFTTSFSAGAAALYKWVDENGQIRYSDRLPPAQVKKKHQQLNKQGVVLSTTEDARSEDDVAAEIEQQQALEKERAEQARLKEIQDKKDQVLLLTFSNEAELGLARKNRIDVIDSVISLIEKSIQSTQETLDELTATAEQNYLSKGKEVPGGLAQKIEHFTSKIESRNAQLELKQNERNRIEQQYQADLTRFRELKEEQN